MHPNGKEFKKLQAVWARKLKKSKFEDAEDKNGNLKDWHSFRLVKRDAKAKLRQDYESTAEYYRRAGQFLYSHQFDSVSERQIWELHCEGKSIKEFRSSGVRSQWKVYQIFHKLLKKMELSWNQSGE